MHESSAPDPAAPTGTDSPVSADTAADAVADPGAAASGGDVHAEWEALFAGTLLERTGTRAIRLAPEGGEMTMPVAGNTQPAGLLHGGATIALAESVASVCAFLHARSVHGPQAQAVGTSVSALHHRSAREGIVRARCRAVHLGRTAANYEIEVVDEAERLISTVLVATRLLPPR